MSTPRDCASARISRASCTLIFSVRMKIFSRSGLTRISSTTPSSRRRGRQVDHAAVEAVPGLQALAHVVVDRDRPGRRLQHLAAPPGRGAEDDVAAAPGMAHRRHLARLAAQDVEHADAVLRGSRSRASELDADVVLEVADARVSWWCSCGSSVQARQAPGPCVARAARARRPSSSRRRGARSRPPRSSPSRSRRSGRAGPAPRRCRAARPCRAPGSARRGRPPRTAAARRACRSARAARRPSRGRSRRCRCCCSCRR